MRSGRVVRALQVLTRFDELIDLSVKILHGF